MNDRGTGESVTKGNLKMNPLFYFLQLPVFKRKLKKNHFLILISFDLLSY